MSRPTLIILFVALLTGPHDATPADSPSANHWAYQPISHPSLPKVTHPDWIRNGIDHFILQKLEQEKRQPSPEAPRHTLIRRAYLDSIGLPPSPDEWHRWMNEPGNDWYETLIDDLLRSPHYGERWGRVWLDQARYADTDGYEKDTPRPHAFQWRDWVIDALNQDLPFDQFTEQQIAGDLLPGAGEKTRTATGFHRNTLTNREGGIDQEEDRVKQVVDRANTTSTIWLGLTVQCAQCHDHKYDPISQAEYFQIYAFFNNSDEHDYPLSATLQERSNHERALADHDQQLNTTRAELTIIRQDILAELPKIESDLLQQHPRGIVTAATNGLIAHFELNTPPTRNAATGKTEALFQGTGDATVTRGIIDGALQLNGKDQRLQLTSDIPFATDKPFSLAAWIRHENGIGGIITRLNEDAQFRGIDFTSNNGILEVHLVDTWPDNAIKVTTLQPVKKDEWHHVLLTYDGSSKASGVALYVDAKRQELKVHYDLLKGSFEIDQPVRLGSRRRSSFFKGLIDEARIYDRVLAQEEISALGQDSRLLDILKIVNIAPGQRTNEQTNTLIDYVLSQRKKPLELKKKLDQLSANPPKLKHGHAMGLVEREAPRRTFTHVRGDFLKTGDEVHPDSPAFLLPLNARGSRPDRLDLARWILHPDNPLTARVTVNRVWQQYFGRGIVESSDDFGSQGTPPSHPQLLDWLASTFVQQGWSLKRLHRLILSSATYRQSAVARPELAPRDPYNTWLARQNRQRVEAETVRDLALAASGLLDRRVKGPSVYPPLPPGIIELAFVDVIDRFPWKVSEGGDRYRRGLYTFFQRTSPYPMLSLFDAPDSNTACTRRERSNTPLQALTLWNDPVFMECARSMATRIVKESPAPTLDQRIEFAVVLSLNRLPTVSETKEITKLYQRSLELYQADTELVKAMVGQIPLPNALSAPELAAWIAVARTLINLDEFITRG